MPEFDMPAPVCFIENTPEGELRVRQEALEILSNITQPVVVVAVVGLYRTGKSFLMNKLAGKRTGFSLGSTIQSETKGIWMWCVPHPKKPNHTLVLLDTEGLGDVEKGDSRNDSWIFALSVLLSSAFVYNSMGTIDQRALEQLHQSYQLGTEEWMKTAGCIQSSIVLVGSRGDNITCLWERDIRGSRLFSVTVAERTPKDCMLNHDP